MDEEQRKARKLKFAELPKGTLLRVNPGAVKGPTGQLNGIVRGLLARDDHLHIFSSFGASIVYPVHAKSMITGLEDAYAVEELLLPGEESFELFRPFDITP